MKKIIYIVSFLLFYCLSCTNEQKKAPESEGDIDAARNFIQAALRGEYETAKTYMIPDSMALERMNAVERLAAKHSNEEKRGLASSTIIMHERTPVNDSTTIVIYSNSYKNNKDTLRILRHNNIWLVDFNYLFDHDKDTTINKIDSIIR